MLERRIVHVSLSTLDIKKDAQGRNICIACEKPLKGRRKKWCSWECTKKILLQQSHPFIRIHLIAKADRRCKICNEQKPRNELILDHIKPIALGGSEFEHANLQILCKTCNKIKTAKDFADIARERNIKKKLTHGQTKLEV